MKRTMLALLILALPLAMQAQFGNLLEKAKGKVINRTNNKIDKGMDKVLDKAEAEGKKATKGGKATTENEKEEEGKDNDVTKASDDKKPSGPAKFTSYSKFDFVPGESVIYSDDFAQDVVAELPLTWNASGKGEVQTIQGIPGKWLRMYQNNTYLSGNKKEFGENFTIEFDLIYYYQPKKSGYSLPHFSFGMFSSGNEDNQENKFLRDQLQINKTEFYISSYSKGAARVESYKERSQTFNSDRITLNNFDENINKPMHYSIQVQKSRLRMWINETKVFDVPRGINTHALLNQLFFEMEGSNYSDDEIGMFVSNIKIATGLPDTRHKLVEEGKFSTTGILFDFQSAVIKPESYGVIKEIANVLKENPSLKINVVGHTSNDGDANANLELSKLRSAAVKAVLVKEFGISEAVITTDGKGGTQPVGDNKTKEGKEQNRRVEFIKV